MKIGALMLARSGCSFIDKNIKEVNGYPLMSFGMMAAKQVKLIDHFYLSSDSDLYLQMGEKYGYSPIKRPTSLSKEDSKSDDAVLHAVKNLKFLRRCDIIIVQHANVITIYHLVLLLFQPAPFPLKLNHHKSLCLHRCNPQDIPF